MNESVIEITLHGLSSESVDSKVGNILFTMQKDTLGGIVIRGDS